MTSFSTPPHGVSRNDVLRAQELSEFAQEVLHFVGDFIHELADTRDDTMRQHPAVVRLVERVEELRHRTT